MRKLERFLFPFGMIGVLFYFLYTILGNLLWAEYNPITTYISALTSDSAPNAPLIKMLSNINGICMMLMLIAIVLRALREYNSLVQMGYINLLILQIFSTVGYALFPMKGVKLDYNSLQNIVHSMISYTVVFFTFVSSVLIAIGYFKNESTRGLGKIFFAFSLLLVSFGAFYILVLILGYNILGLSQRLIIYTIMFMLGYLSFHYTFKEKSYDYESVQRA